MGVFLFPHHPKREHLPEVAIKNTFFWNMIDLVAAHFSMTIEGRWKLHTYISTGNLALQLGIKCTSNLLLGR